MMKCPLCGESVPKLIHHFGYFHRLPLKLAHLVIDCRGDELKLQQIRELLQERDEQAAEAAGGE